MSDEELFNKSIAIITRTEELADKILANKQELTALDKRRQETRETLRLMEKSEEPKVWITVGSILVKMKREQATELLKKDQQEIEKQINCIHSEQKILVNEHRDVEFKRPFLGTNLKPMSHFEFSALKANFPML